MTGKIPLILDYSKEITERIRAANGAGAAYLRLEGLNLTKIPQEIFALKRLEYLDLFHNEITSVPAWLWEMPNLKIIYLAGNPIASVPSNEGITLCIDLPTYQRCCNQISVRDVFLYIEANTTLDNVSFLLSNSRALTNLHRLWIGSWHIPLAVDHPTPAQPIQTLLDSLALFKSIEDLTLSNWNLNVIPSSIRELRQLKRLSLDGLGLSELPEWLSELSLEQFAAVSNQLSSVPDSFRKFKKMRFLDLSWNPLKQIPPSIFDLISLKKLRLRSCELVKIPSTVLQLTILDELICKENPIESPPKEVVKRGLLAIRDYWRQRAEVGVDYLCEAKLIILGEPGAGKTSLARKIENPGYQLKADEKSTEGIAVIRHQFATTIGIREDGEKEKSHRCQFQVNIWDFGGQEIYHATHQFFLTRRSVYVLVCDDRKEDTDFSYWLQVVEMLSDGSPLLILQNEKQDRKRDISLSSLRAQFPNLRVALSANLDTNRGMVDVIKTIQKELASLPHVGVALPATWKRVRKALEREKRDHIGVEDYLTICQKYGFTRREDKLQLSGYLHDLGICLHFQDDPVLKNIVILKPSWGTDAVYRVLDDTDIINARGHFTRKDLYRIWSESKYEGMHDELLQLMMKFQLCYELEAEKALIAPQLLSSEQPPYPWDLVDTVIVRYKYEFLPKGILTRFIVATHHLISGGKLVWKTGVVLERDGCKAEIIEEYSHRRIRVRIQGPSPHGLLTLIDEELQRLHGSFPRLQYKLILPCPCKECQTKAEPHGFELRTLLRMADRSQKIQCHDSGEMVNAAILVRNVLPGALSFQEIRAPNPRMPEIIPAPATAPITLPAFEVFVSYAWNDESQKIVDHIQETFKRDGIHLIRDKEEMRYKDSIRSFMRRIGQGKCIVVIISEKYLKSENCMFEMIEIAKAQNLRERIFPIVLPDARVYKATGRVGYVQHWENEINELDKALKTVRGDNLSKLQEDLTLYSEIRRQFDGIADTLRDMNSLTPEMHQNTNFEELIRRIRAQL
jgi:internalin A